MFRRAALAILILVAAAPLASANPGIEIGFPDGQPVAYQGQEFQVKDLTKVWPSSCNGVHRSWTFGDGHSSSEKDPTHVYENVGVYSLSLTLEWTNCIDKMTKVVSVEVRDHPPVARFEPIVGPLAAGAPIRVDASRSADPDGTISSYVATIDGQQKLATSQPIFAITVKQAGRHLLELVVIDAKNNPSLHAASQIIDVGPGPVKTVQVIPPSVTLPVATDKLFAARGFDAFGNRANGAPSWSATCGQIDQNGTYHAPNSTQECAITADWDGEVSHAHANVTPGQITRITITPDKVTTVVNSLVRFYAEGWDVFGNAQKIDARWSASCGDIIPSGQYTASASLGVCGVTATYDKLTVNTDVLTKEGALFRVVIDPPYAQLRGHETQIFTAIGFDAFNNSVPAEGRFVSDCGYFAEGGQYVAPDAGFTCHIGMANVPNGAATVDIVDPVAPLPELPPLALASGGALFVALVILRRRAA